MLAGLEPSLVIATATAERFGWVLNDFKVLILSLLLLPEITIVTIEGILAIVFEESPATISSIKASIAETSIATFMTFMTFIEVAPIIAPAAAAIASVTAPVKATSCIPVTAIATATLVESLIPNNSTLLFLRILDLISILIVLMLFIDLNWCVSLLVIVAKRFFFNLCFLYIFITIKILLRLINHLLMLLGLLFLLIDRRLDLLDLLCL